MDANPTSSGVTLKPAKTSVVMDGAASFRVRLSRSADLNWHLAVVADVTDDAKPDWFGQLPNRRNTCFGMTERNYFYDPVTHSRRYPLGAKRSRDFNGDGQT